MKNFRQDIMGRLGNNLFQWAFLYGLFRQKLIPDTYLQSEQYFLPFKEEILALLQEGIGKTDKVAIHVRRGDYVGNLFYVDLMQTDYYTNALKEFKGEEFLVFSDDIKWCKKQPLFKGMEFSEGLSDEEDMNLMASCKGHIMSNSSFAWWGAYISPHGGKVIAPTAWYSDGVQRTGLPSHWMKI